MTVIQVVIVTQEVTLMVNNNKQVANNNKLKEDNNNLEANRMHRIQALRALTPNLTQIQDLMPKTSKFRELITSMLEILEEVHLTMNTEELYQ